MLLDTLDDDVLDSPFEEPPADPPIRSPFTALERVGRLSAGETVYRLPFRMDPDAPSADNVRIVSSRISFPFRTLKEAKGFKRPRLETGERGVLIDRDCEINLSLERYGRPSTATFRARFTQPARWESGTAPVIEFRLEGQCLFRLELDRSRPEGPPRFTIPAYLGTKTLTVAIGKVLADREAPRVIALDLSVEEQLDCDYAVVTPFEGMEPFLELVPAIPEDVQWLMPAGSEWRGSLFLGRGRVGVVLDRPQGVAITVDGLHVASSSRPVSELSFDWDDRRIVEIRVQSSSPPLEGEIAWVDPRGWRSRVPAAVRNATLRELARRPVAHVELGGTVRFSLLAKAQSRIRFDPAVRPGDRLELYSGLVRLSSARLTCPPPTLSIELETAGGTRRNLWRGEVSDGSWGIGHFVTVPEDGHILLVIEPVPDHVLGSMQWAVAIAEPRILREGSVDSRPNLLVYLIDTLRADHVSCYGYARTTTPSIDMLARDGVLYENAYAQAPWTRPSVATLFSGLLYSFHGAGKETGLDAAATTIAEVLRMSGFQCAAFIANAQIYSDGLGFEQGFSEFCGVGEGGARAEEINDRALPWIESSVDRPFFLFVHTIDPHALYDPPKSTRGTFSAPGYRGWVGPGQTDARVLAAMRERLRAEDLQELIDRYDEEILANDLALGQILQRLKELRLYDDTIVCVVADHGEEFNEHQGFGHGGRLWEELLRVPLVVKPARGRHRSGLRLENPVRMIDVAPTLLALAGVDFSGSRFQGLPVLPDMNPRMTVIAEEEYGRGVGGLRSFLSDGKKIIERTLGEGSAPDSVQLFDLRRDPGERIDQSDSLKEAVDALRNQLNESLASFRGQGFEPLGGAIRFRTTPEMMEAFRAMGYVEDEEE